MTYKMKAYYILIGFFFFFFHLHLSAQNQNIADSLLVLYHQDRLEGEEKMELLRNISFNLLSDLDLANQIAEELILLAEAQENGLYLFHGYQQKGNALQRKGEFEEAIQSYFKSAETAISIGHSSGVGAAYMTIADVYAAMGNENNAALYYDKAIEALRNTTDSTSLGVALLNAGDLNITTGNLDKALSYSEESGLIFEAIDYQIGIAYNLGNIGIIHAMQNEDDLAEEKINEAIRILTAIKDHYPISVYLTYMADIYADQNELTTALSYANRSLALAEEYGLKKEISDAHLKLSSLHERDGNVSKAFQHYQQHIEQRDSITNLEAIEKLADWRTEFEVAQKQAEVDLLSIERRNQRITFISTLVILLLITLLAYGLYRRYKFTEQTNKIIELEKERSDQLLLNILPVETANELKDKGKVTAKKFESVTIMFTDFKGFTHYAENLSPEDLVKTVDYYFSHFDRIIEKYGLEKIKTIGDAYMCACGLPDPSEDHALKTVKAAIEIADFVENAKASNLVKGTNFDIRIGINTGSVVAGVVGSKKFAYDIWGDAVNVASRMESNSVAGGINISESTYELVKDDFNCSYRGVFDVKNRGKLKMYFVEPSHILV